jgi:putative aminopeptidase FrvX
MTEETILVNNKKGKVALEHIENLAFSRTTSSIGEIKGVNYIREEIEKVGIETHTEFFSFSGPKRFLMRFFYILMFINLILYKLLLVIVLYIALKLSFARFRDFSLIQKEESKNLIAKIPAKNENPKKRFILFSAHHDSFSAIIPYRIQSTLFIIFRLFILPFLVITFLFITAVILLQFYGVDLLNLPVNDIILIYTPIEFVLLIIVFILVFNDERSAGAIDNASGVAVLIEIAKLVKQYDLPKNVDIWFVWTGAEEWGLKGSEDFVKRNKDKFNSEYDLDHSYVINIDMVGTYIGLLERKSLLGADSKEINDLIENSAKELDIDINRYEKILRPITDQKKLQKLRKKRKTDLQVTSIHSDKDSKYIHSPKDRPERCSAELLNDCVDLLLDVIKKIDEKKIED